MVTGLKIKRIKRGMKQCELAKIIGIDRARLCLIENGWETPRAEELLKIKAAIQGYGRRHGEE